MVSVWLQGGLVPKRRLDRPLKKEALVFSVMLAVRERMEWGKRDTSRES